MQARVVAAANSGAIGSIGDAESLAPNGQSNRARTRM